MQPMSIPTLVQISIVSADPQLREQAKASLLGSRCFIEVYSGVERFERAHRACECHIVILDAEMPGDEAFRLAARLSRRGKSGILMLTPPDAADARIGAFAAGADTCISKPLDIREMAAAIGAIERRMGLQAVTTHRPVGDGGSPWHLSNGGWVLNDPAGRRIELTRLERAFVQCLFDNLYEPVSRERLIAAMGGDPYEYAPHRIDVLASRLRRKASEQGMRLALRSVRGTGYALMV